MQRIGIDLGTTNTVAAVGDFVLGLGEDGSNILPSAVAFLPNGEIRTGATARSRRSIDGEHTILSAKRILGRKFDHSITRAYRERTLCKLVEAADGSALFETRAGRHTPTQIASILLRDVHRQVEPLLDYVEVVITLPSAWNETQRTATRTAAALGGFPEVRLLDEPEATVWAYHADPFVDSIVAVYDLGGGTFDVSIVDCGGSSPRILADVSEPFLGGDDVDRQLADWVTCEVLKQANWDLTNHTEVEMRLLTECERAKIALSDARETYIDLANVDPECPMAREGVLIRREGLERLSSRLIQRTFIACDEALAKVSLRPGDVKAVLLAGGSSQMPIVLQGIESYFGRSACIDIDPVEVVARGASQSPAR